MASAESIGSIGQRLTGMTRLLSPRLLLIVAMLMLPAVLASPNTGLWFACLLVPPAIAWTLGGSKAYPVLGWVAGMNWLAIAADILRADLAGKSVHEGWLGPYQEHAILFSLCAVFVVGLGMRLGVRVGAWRLGARLRAMSLQIEAARPISLHRLLVCYVGALALAQALGALATLMPTLAQPLLAVSVLRYVVIYAIAASVFESNRGYGWLILVIGGEFLIGMTAYFANFLPPVFLLIIALISSRSGRGRAKPWILALAAVLVLLWASLVWSVIKPEYRRVMWGMSQPERVTWLADHYLSPIDYDDAAVRLLERVGYTEFYAFALAKLDAGALSRNFDFYGNAIQHVLTSRLLFPGKPQLDDSAITRALTGVWISRDASVGVGYIAEAHVDFGFPGMLVPMLTIGFLLGLAAEYFMTRPVPLLIRQAFATATVFSAFAFAANIDKALGGFVIGCAAMALLMKFVYPLIAQPIPYRTTAIPARGAAV